MMRLHSFGCVNLHQGLAELICQEADFLNERHRRIERCEQSCFDPSGIMNVFESKKCWLSLRTDPAAV
jgi:hypothetical protein